MHLEVMTSQTFISTGEKYELNLTDLKFTSEKTSACPVSTTSPVSNTADVYRRQTLTTKVDPRAVNVWSQIKQMRVIFNHSK